MQENVLTLAMLQGMVRGGLEVRVETQGQGQPVATFKNFWDAAAYHNNRVLMLESGIDASVGDGVCGYTMQAHPFVIVYVAAN